MGATRNCAGCRYWSEMLAQAIDGRPVEAVCLTPAGKLKGKYTSARTTCDSWKSGHFGAVDEPSAPGDETWRLYEEEDADA